MKKILERLKSWKFLLGVLVLPAFVVLNRKLNLGLSPEDLATAAAGVILWITGEIILDAKGIEKRGSPHPPKEGDGPAPEVK